MRCSVALVFVLLVCGQLVAAERVNDLAYRDNPDADPAIERFCKVDLHLPTNATEAPVMVWFHGGGLKAGDRSDQVTVGLAQRYADAGIIVAAAGYRLSPGVTSPTYLEDCAAAVAWVRSHIAEHGGDPAKLFIAGHSAGGYLAAMLGIDGRYLAEAGVELDQIAGVIPVSGQTFTHFTIREERGLPQPRVTPVVDAMAPCYYVQRAKAIPPTLLLCGDRDFPARVEENRYYLAMLTHCGSQTTSYVEVPDRDHMGIIRRMVDADDPGAQAVIAFIKAQTAR